MTPERRSFVGEVKAHRNGDVEAYVSTEDVDRVGDVLTAKGWILDGFRKAGGPVLFGHEYSITAGGQIPLIGNAIEIEIQRKGLWSVTRFHEKTQLSRDAAVLAREKILPSWSVGFRPLERPTDRKDADGRFVGLIYTKQELLEYSLVPVPANPEARSKCEFLQKQGRVSRALILDAAPPREQSRPGRKDEEAIARIIEAGARRIRLAIESARRSVHP